MRSPWIVASLLLSLSVAHAQTDSSGRTVNSGTDASSNAPSLTDLNLLGTLPPNAARIGYFIQVQDTATDCAPASGPGVNGLIVAFDDGSGANLTIGILGFAAAQGAQGSSFDMSGTPHSGRIRYYGKAGCQIGAHQW